MAQHELELILMRELASHLQMPVFVVRPNGDMLFYNEPAEAILGLRFDEAATTMPIEDWGTRFVPTDSDGNELPPAELPLVKTLESGEPSHGEIFIVGADGVKRHLAITAIPLAGASGRRVGAAALFWEAS